MIRIGILGAAKIAPKAIIRPSEKRDDCQVIAIASRDLGKAQDYAKEHGLAEAFKGYDALIERDDIDLIYNALPPNRHMDLSLAALNADKSVLCEKPFALNADEAELMTRAAEGSKGHLIEAFHYRFHPATLKFLEIIHRGTIGPMRAMDGMFHVSIPNRPGELRYKSELGGGALMDLGCYSLHLMRLTSQAEPEIISASAIRSDGGVDTALQADLNFNGIGAKLSCDMREGTERRIIFRVSGEKGEVIFDQYIHPYRDHGFSITVKTETRTEHFTQDDNKALYTRSTYDYQLDHVVNVLTGQTEPLTGGWDAVQTMRSIDAIQAAAS